MNVIGSDCIIIWPFPDPCPFNGVCVNRLHLDLYLGLKDLILIFKSTCVCKEGWPGFGVLFKVYESQNCFYPSYGTYTSYMIW